jgi:NO-binding membrane sensor protein with MHYT domain
MIYSLVHVLNNIFVIISTVLSFNALRLYIATTTENVKNKETQFDLSCIGVIVSNILATICLNNLLVFLSCLLASVSSIIALVFALMAKKKPDLSKAGFKIFGILTLVFTWISLLLTKFF